MLIFKPHFVPNITNCCAQRGWSQHSIAIWLESVSPFTAYIEYGALHRDVRGRGLCCDWGVERLKQLLELILLCSIITQSMSSNCANYWVTLMPLTVSSTLLMMPLRCPYLSARPLSPVQYVIDPRRWLLAVSRVRTLCSYPLWVDFNQQEMDYNKVFILQSISR